MINEADVSGTFMTTQAKKSLLRECAEKNKELMKWQREYREAVLDRFSTRTQGLYEKKHEETMKSLYKERDGLRAQIWIANNRSYTKADNRYWKHIKCHIKCQEQLSKEIKGLKRNVHNMEHQIILTDKQIYELNQKTVPEEQHQSYVAKKRREMGILNRDLEVSRGRASQMASQNAALRSEVETLHQQREHFNKLYATMIQSLNVDKKYLIDLVEHVSQTFDSMIDINEKIKHKDLRARECELIKMSILGFERGMTATDLVKEFISCKNYHRILHDLDPVEQRRRENVKHNYRHGIELYKNGVSKVFKLVGTRSIGQSIKKYREHESLYYTYFNFVNETSFHMTLLDSALKSLYKKLKETKTENQSRALEQRRKIEQLQLKLQERKIQNEILNSKFVKRQQALKSAFERINSIFELCRADKQPLLALLGDHSFVNLHSARKFLKILETRILGIVSTVCIMERENPEIAFYDYIVQNLTKIIEYPTDLDDIVLTQQCPECAEGEVQKVAADDVAIASVADIKVKIAESVTQPDMQYHLHSISECRLPRSRILTAKRFQ